MKIIGTFHHSRWGKVTALAASYNGAKGPLAVVLTCSGDEPLATLSVNMYKPQCSADSKDLPADCFYVKDWSENEDIAEYARASGLFLERPDLPVAISGYVCAEVWQLARPLDA